MPFKIGAINLWNNQRYLGVHPESGSVVDHKRAALYRFRGERTTYICTCRDERHVHAFKRIRSRLYDR